MTDGLTFENTQTAGRINRGNGYQAESVREIRSRANVTDQGASEQERRGLRRLNQALDHSQPLREDVPRGFYLNINI